jgi:proteic killer suppression protein
LLVPETCRGLFLIVSFQLLLNAAKAPQEMNITDWKLHPLKGELADHWAVKVNGNWRLTFTFEGEDAILVNYQDYH